MFTCKECGEGLPRGSYGTTPKGNRKQSCISCLILARNASMKRAYKKKKEREMSDELQKVVDGLRRSKQEVTLMEKKHGN